MGDNRNDAEFVADLMQRLPSTPVAASLEARILDDFDRLAAKRAPGALMRRLLRWRDAVWPGAPLWQPASLLALSLLIGLMAGALVPASSLSTGTTADQTLTADDTTAAFDLYKDL
jgi:hypothetical protein